MFVSHPHFVILSWLSLSFFLLFSCGKEQKPNLSTWGDAPAKVSASNYDLAEIQRSGELIIGTMYGPQSFFEQGGRKQGLQYLLVEDFALHEGLKIRVEIAKDTTTLLQGLRSGDIDILVYNLPIDLLKKAGVKASGYWAVDTVNGNAVKSAWAVREQSSDLSAALNEWYDSSLVKRVIDRVENRSGSTFRHRRIYAPYQSRSKGIISSYDHYFKQYSRMIGWDWRLLAAQCYQESGFDPQAVSWAGARGLMQIMPGTAAHLKVSVSDLFNPKVNVEAGVKYLQELNNRFSNIHSRYDRICFMLAAYNGGYYHILDAMNLARKNGRASNRWSEVAPYVLGLSEPRYFRDPVVKYGYMIGSETYNYVNSVVGRWKKYQMGASIAPLSDGVFTPQRATRPNRFSRPQEILHPSDSAFSK